MMRSSVLKKRGKLQASAGFDDGADDDKELRNVSADGISGSVNYSKLTSKHLNAGLLNLDDIASSSEEFVQNSNTVVSIQNTVPVANSEGHETDALDSFIAGLDFHYAAEHPASRVVTLEDIQLMNSSPAIANTSVQSDDKGARGAEKDKQARTKSSSTSEVTSDAALEEERRRFMEAVRSLKSANASGRDAEKQGLGVIYANDGSIGEDQGLLASKSALQQLEDRKRGKALREVDHSTIAYMPFRKNLFILPRALANQSEEEVQLIRDELDIKVRGKGCPPPVSAWNQCGLSDRILQVLEKHNLDAPFSIQKQALPAIMAGRDIIGIAKTGSGKTLAFLLPLFRHVLDQPPLQPNDGPIGLIMAPARELALQIHSEAKRFTKVLGLKVACIYGGSEIAAQISDIKRGAHIVVCTPGRMIDMLNMHSGRLLTLQRVTMVIMDEADRMFDMGFEPQITMIMKIVRPDRQTALFSATFPKQIEKLARSHLNFPLEIMVGEKSTVNKDITQIIEVHEERDKFLRLLQLLGVWYEKGNVLIFVDKQDKCDQLFADLLKSGYPALSLHGGKDQVDRDYTVREFKTLVKTVMVATGVAGRGLDVPEIVCVINYSCPNHLEDYVHRVGRTGRAGRKGTAYTFISEAERAYAPIMVKVLSLVNEPIPEELKALSDQFKLKVRHGEEKWSSSGFVGKGFTFDASEMNQEQAIKAQQKKAYEVEQGLTENFNDEIDVDEEADKVADGADGDDTTRDKVASASLEVDPLVHVLHAALNVMRQKSKIALRDPWMNQSHIYLSAPVLKPDNSGTIDVKAALKRAKCIGNAISAHRKKQGVDQLGLVSINGEMYFQETISINDYPAAARAKVTHAGKGMNRVMESLGINIVSKGSYLAPGKKPTPENPGLTLVFEGSDLTTIRTAKQELIRMLEEETMRLGTSTVGQAPQGRYNVI